MNKTAVRREVTILLLSVLMASIIVAMLHPFLFALSEEIIHTITDTIVSPDMNGLGWFITVTIAVYTAFHNSDW